MKQPKLSDLKVDVSGTKRMRAAMVKAKKIKITVNVDEEILSTVRQMSEDTGVPYQTLMNRILKNALKSKKNEESRLDQLEREVAALKKKLSA
jgi:predicted DNA binding CopG/RHH family protein